MNAMRLNTVKLQPRHSFGVTGSLAEIAREAAKLAAMHRFFPTRKTART
jgi:hypothetical protein